MLKLSVFLQGHEVLSKSLEPGEYLVGKGPKAQVLLDDPALAEEQARLVVYDFGLRIEDLTASSGIEDNGEMVAVANPAAGAPVKIGPFELRWEAGGGPAAEPSPAVGEGTVVYSPPQEFTDEATVVLSGQGPHQAVFTVLEGGLPQDSFTVSGVAVMGRAADCPVVLAAGTVSRQHAEVQVGPGGVTVRDMGSTSGILVNEQKVDRLEMQLGDRLRLGEVLLELTSAPGAAAAPKAKADSQPQAAAPQKAEKKAAKKKKSKKKKKPAPPAGSKSAGGGGRRPLLYGVLAVVVVILVVAMMMRGGDKKPAAPAVDATITRSQELAESEQKQRLVVINLTKAKQAMAAQAYAQAGQFLEGVLAVDPDNAEAKTLAAQAKVAVTQAEAKRRQAEQQASQRASQAAELMGQLQTAYQADDLSQVVELGKQVLALNPKDANARRLVLQAQAALDANERGRREAEETAVQRQAMAAKLLAQAAALTKKGKLLAARETLNRAALADPQGPGGKQAQKALTRIEPKIKLQSDKAYKKGVRALKRGQLEKAVAALSASLAADPGNVQAAQAMDQARKKTAKLALRMYQEGQVHASLGDIRKACKRWQRALRLADKSSATYGKVAAKMSQCKK